MGHHEQKGQANDDRQLTMFDPQPIIPTKNELFWIEVIRQASRDSDPAPTLDRVRKLRALFMG